MNHFFGSASTRSALVALALLSLPVALEAQWVEREREAGQEITVRNLGPSVNTSGFDYGPTVTADGRTIYFVTDRTGGLGGHDIWRATKRNATDTEVLSIVNVGAPLNTADNEGVCSISGDGQTMYFTGCERRDGKGDCDIYEAKLIAGELHQVRNISEINSVGWDAQPSITSDGRTLYFVSNRPGAAGGDGDADIYMSVLGDDGKWSPPFNVGAPVNTTSREDSPCLSPDGKVLYFSSSQRGGMGGLDFMMSRLQEDGTWGAPANLGAPINTSGDERFITITGDGKIAYFSSTRSDDNKGKLDLFMALAPEGIAAVRSLAEERRTLHVYPNPTRGNITIEVSSSSDRERVARVVDLLGKEVMRTSFQGDRVTLDASTLPTGRYLVRVDELTTTFQVEK